MQVVLVLSTTCSVLELLLWSLLCLYVECTSSSLYRVRSPSPGRRAAAKIKRMSLEVKNWKEVVVDGDQQVLHRDNRAVNQY